MPGDELVDTLLVAVMAGIGACRVALSSLPPSPPHVEDVLGPEDVLTHTDANASGEGILAPASTKSSFVPFSKDPSVKG